MSYCDAYLRPNHYYINVERFLNNSSTLMVVKLISYQIKITPKRKNRNCDLRMLAFQCH